MLCQNCGKYEATTHIKRIVNGELSELHLCTACAEHLGYADAFTGIGFNLSGLLRSFFPEFSQILPGEARADSKEDEARCPTCGCTFRDILDTGMMGCADCYETFYDRLKPSLYRIHGRASHVGKMSSSYDALSARKDRIKELNGAMQKAVEVQDFEKAAELRDEIKQLKGELPS